MIYLLDTDHITVIQRGGDAALPLLTRLRSLASDDFGTTVVTYEEQCRGWTDRIHRARSPQERIDAYACLSDHLRFFAAIAVWEYTPDAEAVATKLQSIRMGTKDRRIAAIAMAHDATLLTRNLRDFSPIPNLRAEDWTIG